MGVKELNWQEFLALEEIVREPQRLQILAVLDSAGYVFDLVIACVYLSDVD